MEHAQPRGVFHFPNPGQNSLFVLDFGPRFDIAFHLWLWGYPALIRKFSTLFSTKLWKTVENLWISVDNIGKNPLFPAILRKTEIFPKGAPHLLSTPLST
ncbi:MAG: hypothetical protein Q4F18_00255 [Clostridia bacterium]|nr:hypothetical protein [Clostridia bacterium]